MPKRHLDWQRDTCRVHRPSVRLVRSSIQISRYIGLGVNADLDFLPSAILTPKSNIADEALPTDPLAVKQQGEWVICDPPAFTRQAQEGIILHRLCHCPGAPI